MSTPGAVPAPRNLPIAESTMDPLPEDAGEYIDVAQGERLNFGDIVADRITREIGSWRFILIYFMVLLLWMVLNTIAWVRHWDTYPFVFLNLLLSFQGAFAAPMILMSQNRQETKDRFEERCDHAVNIRAERQLVMLQASIDDLRRESRSTLAHLCTDQVRLAERLAAIEGRLVQNEHVRAD